jgi:hypothetical protein
MYPAFAIVSPMRRFARPGIGEAYNLVGMKRLMAAVRA